MYLPKYTDRQEEALTALSPSCNIETVLYGGAAGGGKTFLGCSWQINRRLKYPNTRGAIARAELKTLRRTTMATFWRIMNSMKLVKDLHYTYNMSDHIIKFYNGSEILLVDLAYSPSDEEYTKLGSLELTDYFVDEAAETIKKAIDILDSRVRYNLIKGIPKGLLSCNPTKGWLYSDFFDAERKGTLRDDRAFVKALPSDNEHLPQAYLEKLSRLPERDRKRLKDGDWDYDESNDRLYYYDDLLRAFRNEILTGSSYITGDIAGLGEDKTIIGLWSGWSLVDVFVLEKKYPNEVADFIRALAKERNVRLANIVVDADGLGIGVVGILKCRSFNNGGRAVDNETYMNMKAECYFKLGEKINANGITVCTNKHKEEIIQQMEVVREAKVGTDKKKQVTSKDEIKKKHGYSPDFADMIMMRIYFDLHPNYGKYAIR
jgi:hypothetical protein